MTENFTETEVITMFDKSAPQKQKFGKKDAEGYYELEFEISNLSDELLKEFDRLSFVKVETEKDNQIFTSDDLDACEWFFNEAVLLVGGFDGQLPADWREAFDLTEKQAIVREFLSANIYAEDSGAKGKKTFSFGKTGGKTIKLIVVWNGEETIVTHKLPQNAKNFLRRFIQITQGLISKKGKTGTFLPETFEKLGRLYDEMEITVSGYVVDGIPLHHKALVLREAFASEAETNRKKLSR